MGNDFVRSTKDIQDASSQRLDNMKQNDMVSDSEDIYIHNHFKLFPITKSLLNVTSDDSITVRQTAKNIRNVRVNEDWLSDKISEYVTELPDKSEERQYVDDSDLDLPDWLDLFSSNIFYDSKGIYINIQLTVNDTFTDSTGQASIQFPIEIDDIAPYTTVELYKVTNNTGLVYTNIFNVIVAHQSGYCGMGMNKSISFNENVSIGDGLIFSCYIVK